MIKTWLGMGLALSGAWVSSGAHAAALSGSTTATASASEAELNNVSRFVDDSDAQITALASTPDSQFADLDDILDPELAVVFAPDPADVCKRTNEEIQSLAYDPSSRISTYNHGGLFDGGVCWWHSRFQRSSLFLATFRPDLPKATRRQGKAIINALANMSRVVMIPGYPNFYEFTRDYENEVIQRLEAWQIFDGFVGFRWIDGLAGRWHVPAPTLALIMSRIHDLVTVKHHILFEKLHLNRTIGSHAYLVIGSRKTAQGYDIDVIDSNYPGQTLTVTYQQGQTSLFMASDHEPFIPYLDFRGDPGRIDGALHRYCAHH